LQCLARSKIAPDARTSKRPWKCKLATVHDLQWYGNGLVKQMCIKACGEWIKQESSNLMKNSWWNVEKCVMRSWRIWENWREKQLQILKNVMILAILLQLPTYTHA
jgi:hypothetical protein